MKTITIELYTATEMLLMDDMEAVDNVTEKLQDDYLTDVNNFYLDEFIHSMEAVLEGVGVSDNGYTFDYNLHSSYSYFNIDMDEYGELTNDEKKEAVEFLESIRQSEDKALQLTGVYYDLMIRDAIQDLAPNGVTFNNMTKVLSELGNKAQELYLDSEQKALDDAKYLAERWVECDRELFTIKGTMYQGW